MQSLLEAGGTVQESSSPFRLTTQFMQDVIAVLACRDGRWANNILDDKPAGETYVEIDFAGAEDCAPCLNSVFTIDIDNGVRRRTALARVVEKRGPVDSGICTFKCWREVESG